MADFLGVDMKWHPEGYIYGVDGKYHHPSLVYRPSMGDDGDPVTYRAESSPYKIEGVVDPHHPSSYGSPGSFLGVDGKRYQSGYYYGTDGEYHHPDTHYEVRTGKYTDPPPQQRR